MVTRPQAKRAKRPRGRPATGKGTPIQVRIQPALLKKLDIWMRTQSLVSRPAAIRKLLETLLD
jgi:hypothetical protein